MGFFSKMFGSYSDRELKSIYPIVDKIEAMADEYKAMSDAELQAKTPEFKTRLQSGETLDDILPEAFATVREASRRVLGLYPYRVQLVGGVVLHQGRIAEMKTGEGDFNGNVLSDMQPAGFLVGRYNFDPLQGLETERGLWKNKRFFGKSGYFLS